MCRLQGQRYLKKLQDRASRHQNKFTAIRRKKRRFVPLSTCGDGGGCREDHSQVQFPAPVRTIAGRAPESPVSPSCDYAAPGYGKRNMSRGCRISEEMEARSSTSTHRDKTYRCGVKGSTYAISACALRTRWCGVL